jgi:hypothetical protein
MNQVKKRRQSHRSAMVRARWQHFVSAQRSSGLTQSACAIYYSLVESCKLNKVNSLTYLTYLTYVLSHVRDKRVTLLTPDEFNASNITQIG